MTSFVQQLPRKNTFALITFMFQVIAGSLFIALCAQIKVSLPFTPVPISIQTLAVPVVAAMLGKVRGTLAVCMYLSETTLGLPFLAGGASNPLALIGPTGGYLAGMIVQAYLTGWYYDTKSGRNFMRDFTYNLGISFVLLGIGCAWLTFFVGASNVLYMGFYPFLIGDAIKMAFLTKLMITTRRLKI